MHIDITHIGNILKSARKAKGHTQQELADLIGSSLRTITDLENDNRYPSYDVLFRIIVTLDIDANLIFRPHATEHTVEQHQILLRLSKSSAQEKRIVFAMVEALVRELGGE